MKNKISVMVLGLGGLLVCTGFAAAGEVSSFNAAYRNPQEAVKSTASNITLPAVSQVPGSKTTSNSKQVSHIVVMQDLLGDLPAADRAVFLNSLVLKNGRVVSADLAALKNTLSEDDINTVVTTIFYRSENDMSKKMNSGRPARFAKISELLAGVSPFARNNFLDSLTFKDGYFVSAQVGGLSEAVTTERLDEIIKAIATSPGPLTTFNPKELCGNGVCYKAYCYTPHAGGAHCRSHKTSVCDTACRDYD